MKSDSGNVLFLILIAVALFAALSYAVTQSSRSGGDGISKDKAKLSAARLVQYGNEVEQAISRIRVINRTPEYALDVASPVTYGSLANATCATSACQVFHLDGGGISPRLIDDETLDTSVPSAALRRSVFRSFEIVDIGSGLDELALAVHGIKKEVCSAINKAMGIDDGGNPPLDNYSGYGDYRGTLTSFPEGTAVIGDQAAAVKGKRTFCAYYSSTEGYIFYHVLMER